MHVAKTLASTVVMEPLDGREAFGAVGPLIAGTPSPPFDQAAAVNRGTPVRFVLRISLCSTVLLLCAACEEDIGPRPIEMVPTDVGAAWSPDGSMLAVDYRPGDASDAADGVYIVDLTSGDRRFIAPFAAEPDWSPDGSKLALSGGGTMSVADLTTGEIVPFDLPEFSIDPSWSPDGSTIAFSSVIGISNPPVLYVMGRRWGKSAENPVATSALRGELA